ncbi:5-oxoprolinase subunit PxpB [Pseudoalteromonas denitrificans]|uniref:Inhibitor of KinA n=1 Tax=Pseudoalteromonas denitrificans DSM 6059 TaxID=1123010 RepID=A0A1I1P530_9GAMM|nr:5-oxoprolinase subunit PxpB [Pseudoalteromonas denitrificans]SFD02093.1 inhibitor of KinA [Pseudoalteromonas denitrificans DSM 6059]
MIKQNFRIVSNGDSAITILFIDEISELLSQKIILLKSYVWQEFTDDLVDIIPAYQSLTICFKPYRDMYSRLEKSIKQFFNQNLPKLEYDSKLIEIPVCYEQEFAPDLIKLAKNCGLTSEQVIDIHTQHNYLVHMLGFLPGFLYLGGLPSILTCPRKSIPELSIPAGSVAIGGNQTGVYPVASPGGWHIIGRTPLNLFKADEKKPFIANPLDKIRFVSITKFEFDAMKKSQL